MEIKQSIFLFLFFIISTYGDLIPNDRVTTDSNSTKDFNLVEGITYSVVHLKSGLNLVNDNNRVCVSVTSSPYQYWTLRKASDNRYNIINVGAGRNLDSNGQSVYLSKSKDNSKLNQYQHWVFKSIEDNLFDIVHVKSRNLDSDGSNVYISDSEHDTKTNPYQQWFFEPSNYNLTAVVTDFEYPPELKDNLDKYKTRTSLLSGNYIIENNANVTIEETIDKTELKLNTYGLVIRKSDSLRETKNVGMSFHLGGSIFGLLRINTGFAKGIKREFRSTLEKIYSESVTEMVQYQVRQKITVPPYNSVMVNSTVDKVSINDIPFKAKIRITGKADRLDKYGKVVSMTDVEVNAIRCYLRKENFNVKNITVEGNSLIVDTVGTMRIDGYGLETRIETIEIPHKIPKSPEPPKSPSTEPPKTPLPEPSNPSPEPPNPSPEPPKNPDVPFYNYYYYSVPISFFIALIFVSYRSFLSCSRRDYHPI